MDPTNPVLALCRAGLDAAAQGRPHEARSLFEQAWRSRLDDVDACIAAHHLARHLARHDAPPEDVLRWSHLALEHALTTDDDQVRGLLAPLHHDLGRAHELLGELAAARRHYELAAANLDEVDDGARRDGIAGALSRALARVALDPGVAA